MFKLFMFIFIWMSNFQKYDVICFIIIFILSYFIAYLGLSVLLYVHLFSTLLELLPSYNTTSPARELNVMLRAEKKVYS